MRIAGAIAAEALIRRGEAVKPGVTTKHINDVVARFIKSKNGVASFKGYGRFPAEACISVNEESHSRYSFRRAHHTRRGYREY